ncbi:MAG TPA: hypothetical protein VIY28_12245 [Pseudonocardiaceae bacterium]
MARLRAKTIDDALDLVRWLAGSNTIVVLWKIAVPVLTVIVLIVVSFRISNFTAGGGFAPYGAHGVLAALPLGG